jgi:hypothetical protein
MSVPNPLIQQMNPVLTTFPMWVVTENPSDHPGLFVVRKHRVMILENREVFSEPTAEHWTGSTVEEVRQYIPEGLVSMPPTEGQDPVIVETWIDSSHLKMIEDAVKNAV